MTKVTELPFLGEAGSNTSFIVVDNKLTRRIGYNSLKIQLGRDLSLFFDQALYTTSSVVFNTITATNNIVSLGTIFANRRIQIGGLTNQYAFDQGDPMLILGNRFTGPVPTILLQGYKLNFNSNFSFLNRSPYPIIRGEVSGGTFNAPTAVSADDGIFSLSIGGHDGITWISTRGFGNPGRMFFASQENWGGTFEDTTNAGIRFSFQLQPPSVYLSTSSRQTIIHQYWSEFGNGQLPKNNIGFGGGADGVNPSLRISNDTYYTGYGSTNVFLNNSTFSLYGVPREDSNPDNYTLPDTLSIAFYASQGSGSSARRNRIQKGNTLGRIQFFGETGVQSTSTVTQIKTAELFVKSLNTFTSTATGGAVVVLTTLNSGTNIESPRLSLSNVEHIYSSDIHSFKTANSSTIVTINTTSFVVKSVRAVRGTVPAGFSPMYYNTSTGEIIVVY